MTSLITMGYYCGFMFFGLINHSFYAMVLECVRSTNEGFLNTG